MDFFSKHQWTILFTKNCPLWQNYLVICSFAKTYDIRGSVNRVSDGKGATTAEYTYSTYGNRISEEPYDYFILGYCARDGVLTEANGLLYMRARYYSPDLMRFINEDIVTGDISNSNSLNRYSYVEGNPVTMVDPFGLCGKSCISSNLFEGRSKVASLSRTEYMWDLLVLTCKYEFYQNASPETLQTIGDVCDVRATFFDYLGQVLDNTSKIWFRCFLLKYFMKRIVK